MNTTEGFLQEMLLLFLKHFVSEYISLSHCKAAFPFLSLDLSEFITRLFVCRLNCSVLFAHYWKDNCILHTILLQ